jgi:magnesium-protoporphyrin IX monomethyl ester (oxidative) cyclase
MKITLINPKYVLWSPNVWAPLGLAYIAASLEKAGHKVKIIDMNAFKISDRDALRMIRNSDAIGIGGLITEYMKILNLADLIKDAYPDKSVIVGGPCTTTLHEKVLERTKADYAVIGEGEVSTVNLINAIEKSKPLKNVKGIVFRDGDKTVMTEPQPPIENIDVIPFPARHLLKMEKYIYNYFETIGIELEDYKNKEIRNTTMLSSRGCPYRCIFCDKGIWGYRWRFRSPQNIIDEITLLKEKYKINCIFFDDDTFVVDRNRVEKFSDMMKDLDIIWFCDGRVNLMQSKEIFVKMRQGNCRLIGYGIESGNQKTLDLMKKMITLDQVRNSVRYAKETGIKVGGFFILGMLGETKQSIEKTFEFARELKLDYYTFSVATPYPGTELYEGAIKEGFIKRDQYDALYESDWLANVSVNLTRGITNDELRKYQNKAFIEFVIKKQFGKYFYLHPRFLKEMSKVMISLRNYDEAKRLGSKIKNIIKSSR